jgi:hypothetical protein
VRARLKSLKMHRGGNTHQPIVSSSWIITKLAANVRCVQ